MTNPDPMIQMRRNVFIDLQSDYFCPSVQVNKKGRKEEYKATLVQLNFPENENVCENSISKSGNQESRNRTRHAYTIATFQLSHIPEELFRTYRKGLSVFRNFDQPDPLITTIQSGWEFASFLRHFAFRLEPNRNRTREPGSQIELF